MGGETDEKRQKENCRYPERNRQQSWYSAEHSHQAALVAMGIKTIIEILTTM